MIPLKGWSIYGGPGGPLYDPRGNRKLIDALKENLNPDIELEEIDAHINDTHFIENCVEKLFILMERQ